MSLKEGYLHDYLVASFIGLAFGIAISFLAADAIGDWGKYIAAFFVVSIFGFLPSGLVAGYVNFRLHRVSERLEMAGLSAGFFTAIVYTIIGLFTTLVRVIMTPKNIFGVDMTGNYFVAWVISVLFAFIFISLGGYICGFLERRPFAMPAVFDLSRISRGPPPPPAPTAIAQMCSTCGQPLTFVQQYNRWYCANCRKYQ